MSALLWLLIATLVMIVPPLALIGAWTWLGKRSRRWGGSRR
jgi:hypothetical protein